MDRKTGSLLAEEVAEDRTYTTGKALVDERLKALGTQGLAVVSDRAQALLQLAEKAWEGLSMPEFFHLVPAIVKGSSLALGRRVRHAHTALKAAQETLARLQGGPHAAHDGSEAKALVDTRQGEATRWAKGHTTYRCLLETLSSTRHPFNIVDSAPQTSAQVASRLQTVIEATAGFAQRQQ